MRVKFEPGHLREILKTAPKSSPSTRATRTLGANGRRNVVFAPPMALLLSWTWTGPALRHAGRLSELCEAGLRVPWLHHSGGTICEPTDIPVNKRHLDMVYAHMRYSDKALWAPSLQRSALKTPLRCRVSSSAMTLLTRTASSWATSMSTRRFCGRHHDQIGASLCARQPGRRHRALYPGRGHGAGDKCRRHRPGPCRDHGGLRHHAAGAAGAPVIYGNFLSSMSLRSGSPPWHPRAGHRLMVIGQLARRLNLPLRCAGSFTTSKLPDGQAMQESVMSMLSAIHCGANFILHSAGFWTDCFP